MEKLLATDFRFREDMIWKAMSAVGSSAVKNPVAYINRMKKRFGDEYFLSALKVAYEISGRHCYAKEIQEIDKVVSAKYGWKTIIELRA